MANSSSGKNEERNPHHDASSGKFTTPVRSSGMRHGVGISLKWTDKEVALLENCLASYSSDWSVSNVSRYVEIAKNFADKTVRDVAARCRWIYEKENKKRNEDDDEFGKVNNKEIISRVMASNLTEKDVNTLELLDHNVKLLNQISANLTSFNVVDNTLLVRFCDNMKKILNNLSENMPERMNLMPPLPEKLNDDQADSILPPPNPP